MTINLKTNYLAYDDIENPFRNHFIRAVNKKLEPKKKLEKQLSYHRNVVELDDSYMQLTS